LSYTRARVCLSRRGRGLNCHASIRRLPGPGKSRMFHAPACSEPALNIARFAAYIAVSVNNERR